MCVYLLGIPLRQLLFVAMLFQEIFENIDPCFLDTMLIMETQSKETYIKISLSFKSNLSKCC